MLVENTDYREEFLDLGNPYDVKLVSTFLKELDFNFIPESIDKTMVIYNLNDDIIGTGSLKKNVLKYIVVAPKYRETTAFAMIISQLTENIMAHYKTAFVFTRPQNVVIFKGLGFRHIATSEPYFSLLEYGTRDIKKYQEVIATYKKEAKTDNIASLVVNCNPYTKGHEFLIEKAASENEWLYLFVVQEDFSVFPFDVRWNLLKKGTEHLKNVIMIPGGDYIVSGKTFPHYFLKGISEDDIVCCQGKLDITIFCKYIAPIFGIKKRYVGTEIYCKTTAGYNEAMRQLLPEAGIEFIELSRVTESINGENVFISASRIRNAIKKDELEKYWDLLPKATQLFFLSEESEFIKEKIKMSDSRH